MASRNYLNDYRLENVEKNGKLKTVAVYKGKAYRFRDPAALAKARPVLIAAACCFWLFQLVALTVRTRCAHYLFAVMPMVFAMLPFFFASRGIFTAAASRGDMRREQAEKLEPRLAGGSLIAAFLSGASLVGSVISFIIVREAPTAGDMAFILSAALQTVSAALCFTKRASVRTEEAPSV